MKNMGFPTILTLLSSWSAAAATRIRAATETSGGGNYGDAWQPPPQQQPPRTFQILDALYAIQYSNGATTADVSVDPTTIVSSYVHSDITNVEANGPTAYGSVSVQYYNVADQGCYNEATDNGASCTCSTSSVVHSISTNAPIAAVFTTADNGSANDNAVTTTVVGNVATLLDSDAATVTSGGTVVYVAYCLRLGLWTAEPNSVLANAQDVLIYFTGPNDANANTFVVQAMAKGGPPSGGQNPTPSDFTVTAQLCPGATVGSMTTPLTRGTDVSICIESNDDPAAQIQQITYWKWSVTTTGPNPVMLEQIAIDGPGSAANVLSEIGPCQAAVLDAGGTVTSKSRCEFRTLLVSDLYDAIGVGNTGIVTGTGMVNLAFNGESRRRRQLSMFMSLKRGDVFGQSAALNLVVTGTQADDEGPFCDCIIWNIICWIFRCLLPKLFTFFM